MSALIFIFVLSVLVVIHEFGHFIVAKWCGIRVEKFSVGFGPVIFGKKFGETEYVVSLLPLGGFVKLAGESPQDAKGEAWEFNSKTLVQKFLVVLAGPFMNAFLAFVLFAGVFMAGQPMLTTVIGKVLPDAPAHAAGIKEGDRILAVDGKKIDYWEDLLDAVHKGSTQLVFDVERGHEKLRIAIEPKQEDARDVFGRKSKVNFVGVAPANDVVYIKNDPLKAIVQAWNRLFQMTVMILFSLWLMITGAMPFKESVTGPIGIFFMTQQAAQMGFHYLCYFMASLSVSLFVLNLLPIPVLDGGHILFIAIEKIKGSPLKDVTKERMTQVGLVALLGLMVFVIFQDIHRFAIIDNVLKVFKK